VPWLARPDGCRVWFELSGDPRRPPLLLLPGIGDDLRGWRRNVPHLAEDLFVVGCDLRGNGPSELPAGPVTMTTFVGDAVALLDELALEGAHVYGHSLGGMVAQELAIGHGRRVRALVLGATHPGGAHTVRSRARVPKDRPDLALYAPSFAAAHPEHVREDLRVQGPPRPGAGRRQWDAVRGFDAFERLPSIAAPTLVLHGTEDGVVDPANAAVLASRIPGAELVMLEGAGHRYQSERAERADRIVLDFLRRHPDV
jgi:pimeloyl-ACP methyl ester carboxylesterase